MAEEYKAATQKKDAPSTPHVIHDSPPSGPLAQSLSDQMQVEMGALPTKDPHKGF